jgi:hypothetical protein
MKNITIIIIITSIIVTDNWSHIRIIKNSITIIITIIIIINNYSNSQLVPYKNPHEGRLHYMRDSEVLNDYYNIQKIFIILNLLMTMILLVIILMIMIITIMKKVLEIDLLLSKGVGANLTQNLSNLDSRPKLVCFDELLGKCFKSANDCKYSHDFKDLQKENLRRLQELEASKYCPRERRRSSHPTIPTSIMKRDSTLRAMGTVDGDCKVSTSKSEYTNEYAYDTKNRSEIPLRNESSSGYTKK